MVRQGKQCTWMLAAVAALAVLVPAAPAAAREDAVLFKPAKTSNKKVTFRVRGVESREVVRASLVRRGKERRGVGRDRARRITRRGVLRVRVAKSRKRIARFSGRGRRKRTLWVGPRARRTVKLKVVTDTRAPDTRITSSPSETTESEQARFRFRADERGSTFECRLDSFDWVSCDSSLTFTVPQGEHTLRVRARDRAGNVEGTPAEHAWIVTAATATAPAPAAQPGSKPDAATPTTDPVAPVPSSDPAPAGDPNVLFGDAFTGSDGVITNHYAFWSPDDESAFRSPNWEMESGCALRQDNTLWTGVPTSNIPNRNCSNGSGSEIFRLWTKRDFSDVDVRFSLRNNGYVSGAQGERSWDGVKIWLRRQGASGSVGLYTAEVNRRQGNIMIQKKCAGSDTYHILEQARPEGSDAAVGQWEQVGGSVRNAPDGSVRLALVRHGQVVLEATDDGVGCAPITAAGRIGVRGDYVDFNVDDFAVTPAV